MVNPTLLTFQVSDGRPDIESQTEPAPVLEPSLLEDEGQTTAGIETSHGSEPSSTRCKARLSLFFGQLKNFFMVFVFKFVLGICDVASDLVTGINYLNGQYGLSLYFIAGVSSDYAGQYESHPLYASLTLTVVWLPGIFRTVEMALKTNWRQMRAWDRTRKAAFLITMVVAWPAINPFM